jgi:hypothetical protein
MAGPRIMLVPIDTLDADRLAINTELAIYDLHLAEANLAALDLEYLSSPVL